MYLTKEQKKEWFRKIRETIDKDKKDYPLSKSK